MKKLLLSILTLYLVFSLAACGEDTEKTSDKESEKKTEKASDDSKEDKDDKDSSGFLDSLKDKTDKGNSLEPKQEIIDASWDSGLFQINDTLIQLPIRLSEWMELGFDYNPVTNSKDYLYNCGEYMGFDLLVNNEKICTIFNIERTDEGYGTLEETDPLIESVTLSSVNILTNKVYAPGNLQFGQSFKTIEETFGKPLLIEDVGYYPNEKMEYRYGYVGEHAKGPEYGLYVGASKSTQEIEYFSVGKSMDSCSYDELVPINLPYKTLLWSPDYTHKFVHESQDYSNDDRIRSVFEYNGQYYVLELSSGVSYGTPRIYYDEIIYEETDENGVFRGVYTVSQGRQIQLYCQFNDRYFSGYLTIENISYVAEDEAPVKEKLKDLLIEIVKSVQLP